METIDILLAIMTISMFLHILFHYLAGTKLMDNLFAKIIIYFATILSMIIWVSMIFILIFIIEH